MQVRNLIMTVSLVALTNSVALAKGSKKEPNCDVSGKKIHVKDEASCTKKKGVWSNTQAADASKSTPVPVTSAPAPQTTPSAPAEGDVAPAK